MALYEHVFIARQDISETQVATLTQIAENIVVEGGGKVTKSEYWGLRSLAYKIQKNRRGHYSLLNIDAEHTVIGEIERQFGLHDDILRFLTLRVEAHEDGPSAPMRSKAYEEEKALSAGRSKSSAASTSNDSASAPQRSPKTGKVTRGAASKGDDKTREQKDD